MDAPVRLVLRARSGDGCQCEGAAEKIQRKKPHRLHIATGEDINSLLFTDARLTLDMRGDRKRIRPERVVVVYEAMYFKGLGASAVQDKPGRTRESDSHSAHHRNNTATPTVREL